MQSAQDHKSTTICVSRILLVTCLWAVGARGQCFSKTLESPSLLQTRIVGGDPSKPGRYPYMASIRTQQSRAHICGGMLVAKDLVLTAAHCVHKDILDAVPLPHIKIGGIKIHDDPDAEDHEACRTFVHNKYNGQATSIFPYDIALIQLQGESYKTPLSLGTADDGKVTALGWGRSEGGRRAETLQEVGLQVLDLDECRATPGFPTLLDSQMCAKEKGRDACAGDSGGPLLRLGLGCGENDSLWGIVSGGPLCFYSNGVRTFSQLPGIYTRVSSFREWVNFLPEDEFTVYTNPSCTKDPPAYRVTYSGEDKIMPPAASDLPDLQDDGGCYSVEGIDFGKGVGPMNDGTKDITSSPQQCCNLCKNTPGCRAWTYIRVDEKYSPKGSCWLRSIIPPPSRCTVCTSGLVKQESLNAPEESCKTLLGMDIGGEDLWSIPAGSIQQCCQICKDESSCRSYTFNSTNKWCFLKDGIGELRICAECHSGIIIERVKDTDDLETLLALIPGIEDTVQNLRQITIPGPCRLSVGMDLKGGVLLNKDNLPFVQTPEECCNLCRRTEGCRSWTMITAPTKYHNPSGQCYMKSTVPEEVPCAACTSGVVEGEGASGVSDSKCGLLEGVYLQGSDASGPKPITDSPRACCNMCEQQSGCKSWTRTKHDGRCFMKNAAVPVITLCSGCDSGIHLDKVTASEISSLSSIISKT